MKNKILTSIISAMLLYTNSYSSENELPRVAIKTNGQLVYNDTPGKAESFSELFSKGEFYGRIRSNNFYWWWKNDDIKHNSHLISGLGGSVVYKSAVLSGVSFGAGLYYSRAFFDANNDPLNLIKAGKDVGSRYDYLKSGKKDMGVLGQAYLKYQYSKSDIQIGRQLVETFYTKSNDTKMIPNTFDGIVVSTKDIPKTSIKVGYLTDQKLRDHTKTHPVLMYGDCAYDNCFDPEDKLQQLIAAFSGNDDAAMHRGLTYTRLLEAGKDTHAPLIVGDIKNSSIKNLKAQASFYNVPTLLIQGMVELNYKIVFDGFSITPGVRYIQQFDDGAGAVGGASLNGKVSVENPAGYTDPNSLDSYMIGARIVTRYKDYRLNLAYTGVADEADLVTPWRGFPTAGYTRSMGRYNWKANTKSYRVELVKGANKTGIYTNMFIQASVLYTDYDEAKGLSDEMYYYVGFVHNPATLPQMQWRLRLGYAEYADAPYSDYNYVDSRFEVNYVF